MAEQQKDMADELAYVRSLAEEGRNAPLVGGVIYVIWGGLIGSAALVQYAEMAGLFSLKGPLGWAPWFGAFFLGWVLSFLAGRRTSAKPGARTIGNRTAAAAWFAVGLFISGFWITLFLVHDRYSAIGVPEYFLYGLMFPIAFGLYGVAFFASATAARLDWLRWFALAAWAFSFTTLFLLDNSLQMLVGGIGTFLCALLPGFILMRREPSDIV
ncbi:MAG: hypothetical protein WD076_00760 [Parvularculaceae bacterium]